MKNQDLNNLQALVVDLNDIFLGAVYNEMEKKEEKECNYFPFSIQAGQPWGYDPIIEFMGVYIWGGADEVRKCIKDENEEDTDEYEDLHDFLITQACLILKQLNTGMVPLMIQTNDVLPTSLEDQPKDDELNF